MLLAIALRIKSGLEKIPAIAFLPFLILTFIGGYYLANASQSISIDSFLSWEFFTYVLVGIGAQLIDGALGMAYGVSSSSFLMSVGVSPAAASAAVHVSEVFTTGASALSHLTFKNVNKNLFKSLVIPGVLGAITGAYLLSSFNGDAIKPFVAAYLLIMGVVIIRKAFRKVIEEKPVKRAGLLAYVGGFCDSVGGGGWGPVVTSTLMGSGGNPKFIIGTVNTTEFFVTLASAGVFTLMIGLQNVNIIAGLVVGGIIAAPFGAFLVGKVNSKALMILVGTLIIFLSIRTLIKYLPL